MNISSRLRNESGNLSDDYLLGSMMTQGWVIGYWGRIGEANCPAVFFPFTTWGFVVKHTHQNELNKSAELGNKLDLHDLYETGVDYCSLEVGLDSPARQCCPCS